MVGQMLFNFTGTIEIKLSIYVIIKFAYPRRKIAGLEVVLKS